MSVICTACCALFFKSMYVQCIKYFFRVQVGRLWLPSSYNPGLHVRNRYGSSVYKHVEHWLSLGKRNGWLEYGSSTHFTPCPRPDHHACLDHFETDGNIQFQMVSALKIL